MFLPEYKTQGLWCGIHNHLALSFPFKCAVLAFVRDYNVILTILSYGSCPAACQVLNKPSVVLSIIRYSCTFSLSELYSSRQTFRWSKNGSIKLHLNTLTWMQQTFVPAAWRLTLRSVKGAVLFQLQIWYRPNVDVVVEWLALLHISEISDLNLGPKVRSTDFALYTLPPDTFCDSIFK